MDAEALAASADYFASLSGGGVSSSDSDFFASSLPCRARFCDTSSSSTSSSSVGPCDLYAATFHPGGRHAIGAGFDRCVRVWDLETGACLHTLAGHTGAVRCH